MNKNVIELMKKQAEINKKDCKRRVIKTYTLISFMLCFIGIAAYIKNGSSIFLFTVLITALVTYNVQLFLSLRRAEKYADEILEVINKMEDEK